MKIHGQLNPALERKEANRQSSVTPEVLLAQLTRRKSSEADTSRHLTLQKLIQIEFRSYF
ncbi:MAG: hypothetical protein ACRC2R_06710 [Xenococcaceae cyanobacterium]